MKGCRIDTGPCKKVSPKSMHPPRTSMHLEQGSCKPGTGLGGQRARQALGYTYSVYEGRWVYGYRQSLVGLSAHCKLIPTFHTCMLGSCRNLHSVHSVQLNSVYSRCGYSLGFGNTQSVEECSPFWTL